MPISPSQVVSRSNSDLSSVISAAQNTDLRPEERMALILRTAQEWDRATAGSTGRVSAERIHETHYPFGVRRP